MVAIPAAKRELRKKYGRMVAVTDEVWKNQSVGWWQHRQVGVVRQTRMYASKSSPDMEKAFSAMTHSTKPLRGSGVRGDVARLR